MIACPKGGPRRRLGRSGLDPGRFASARERALLHSVGSLSVCTPRSLSSNSNRRAGGVVRTMPGPPPARVPRAAERRSVAKIEIVEIFDARLLEEGRGDDIDPLGYLGSSIPYDLAAQQPSSSPVACQVDAERHRAGVIGLMVIDLRIHCYWIEPRRARVSFIEAGTCDRQVEHLETLCSERAREPLVVANRILACNPPLLVCDRSQGDIGRRIKQAVVRLDAIACRKNVCQVCAHLSRDDD
jgi:hypothetical protein